MQLILLIYLLFFVCFVINLSWVIIMGVNYKTKKPSVFYYGLFRILSLILSKFAFNLKVQRNEIKNKKGPFLVIANHESFIDFINLAACNRNRMHFVVSNSFYQSLPINPILKRTGVIPKQQFQTTMEDLKKMKRVLDDKMPLVIYPAGLMSEDGISTPIPKGTGKLLKWFNCDVYVAKIKGSYFTNPKWSKAGFRKGKVTLDIYKLYEKGQCAHLSEEELFKTVDDVLKYDCYEYQEKDLIVYRKHKNIKGLENVLYQCPKCNKEFSMITEKNKLICTCCNNTAISDKYGLLHKENADSIVYKRVSDWARFIKTSLYKEVINNQDFIIESDARVSMINYKKHKFVDVGEVHVSLQRSCFKLKGIINNEPFEKEISTYDLFILPFSPGKFFEIQNQKDIYRIYLKDGRHVTKWLHVLKAIFIYNHSKQVIAQ